MAADLGSTIQISLLGVGHSITITTKRLSHIVTRLSSTVTFFITVLTCAVLGGIVFVGCATTAQTSEKPQEEVFEYRMPYLTPLGKTEESQSKGGIQISIAPVSHKVVRENKVTTESADPGLGQALLKGAAEGASGQEQSSDRYVRVKKVQVPRVKPDSLRFLVTVSNQMSRVFRGSGAVVQFNINGNLKGVDQSSYRSLTNAIIPPRNEQQFRIYGPPLSTLPKNANIGVFIYDVVTKTDESGKVTEKQNFEWYFKYTTEVQKDTAVVETKEGWVNQ